MVDFELSLNKPFMFPKADLINFKVKNQYLSDIMCFLSDTKH